MSQPHRLREVAAIDSSATCGLVKIVLHSYSSCVDANYYHYHDCYYSGDSPPVIATVQQKDVFPMADEQEVSIVLFRAAGPS